MSRLLFDSLIYWELQEALYISGDTYYCYCPSLFVAPNEATSSCFYLEDFAKSSDLSFMLWNSMTFETDSVGLCFDFFENCEARIEFYKSFIGQPYTPVKKRYWRFLLGILEHYYHNILWGETKYTFLEYFFGSAGINDKAKWGLTFYRQLLEDQFFLFSNSLDYSNPKINNEESLYMYAGRSLNLLNTHYDIVFPYFMESSWKVLPLDSFWFSNEYKYTLPCGFNNLQFLKDYDKMLLNTNYVFKNVLLLFDYDLLVFNKKSIILYAICYFLFNYKWIFVLIYFFILISVAFRFNYLNILGKVFFKFYKFIEIILSHIMLLFISFASLISATVHIFIEQYMWWYFYTDDNFWAMETYARLYDMRNSFLHYYLRFAIVYFWRSAYFFFYVVYNFVKLSILRVPYSYSFIVVYLFIFNILYYAFITVPIEVGKKLWNGYLWFMIYRHLFIHTEVIFKILAIFNKHFTVRDKYYKFRPYNEYNYKYMAFFTSYYKRGGNYILFNNNNNYYYYCFYFFFSVLSFLFCYLLAIFIKVFIYLLKFHWIFFLLFKLLYYLKFLVLRFGLGLDSGLGFIVMFKKFLKLPFFLIFSIFIFFYNILKLFFYKYYKFMIFIKNGFFSILKLVCCCINFVFFNFLLFLLYFLPKIFFIFFKLVINYRMFLFIILCFFAWNIKIIVSFFIIILTWFLNHYLPLSDSWLSYYVLISNPNKALYSYDVYSIRFGEYYFLDWTSYYEDLYNLYRRVCERWWDFNIKKKWRTRYKYVDCFMWRFSYWYWSKISAEVWYVLYLHWDYSLIYLVMIGVKKFICFFIWFQYFMFFVVVHKIFFFFFPKFIIYIFFLLWYIFIFLLKFFFYLIIFIKDFLKIILQIITLVLKEYLFFFNVYKFLSYYFINIYIDFFNFIFEKFSFFIEAHLEFLKNIDFTKTDISCCYVNIENWLDYYVLKLVIMYWYIELIVYDLFNFGFFEFVFNFFKNKVIFSTVFINLFFEAIDYFYVACSNFINESFINVFILKLFLYMFDLYDRYIKSMNLVVFMYFCWEIVQYYLDIFCLNIEFSRLNFLQDHLHIEKRTKVHWYYRHGFPVIFKAPFYYHYALTDFRVLKSLQMPAILMLNRNSASYYFWFNFLYYNSFSVGVICFFILFFFFKGFRSLFFFKFNHYANPDHLWALFRNKRIEDVQWLFRDLNEFAQNFRAFKVIESKYSTSKEEFEYVQQVRSQRRKDAMELEKKRFKILSRVKDEATFDKEFAERWWQKEMELIYKEGNIDFLEFFNSPFYNTYYDNAYKDYLNFGMLIAYAFSRDDILRRLNYYECEIELLEKLFLDEYVNKKTMQEYVKGYFLYLDKFLYNYKLPYWTYHKDFFSYKIIGQHEYRKKENVLDVDYRVIVDFPSLFYSVFVWFWILPIWLLKFILATEGIFKMRESYFDLSFMFRTLASHFFDFELALVDKLGCIYWDALGPGRRHSGQSVPFKHRSRNSVIKLRFYYEHCYYEGPYIMWASKNYDSTLSKVLFFFQNYKFYGFTMFNSNCYCIFSYLYICAFVIYFYLLLKKRELVSLKDKNDLIFFTRQLLIRLWKADFYFKLKSHIRSYLLKN